MTNRRGFMASILAAGFAPSAIGSGVLMPVRSIVAEPSVFTFHSTFVRDIDGRLSQMFVGPWEGENQIDLSTDIARHRTNYVRVIFDPMINEWRREFRLGEWAPVVNAQWSAE